MLILQNDKLHPNILLDGYTQWMDRMQGDGAKLYYVNFMFQHLGGGQHEIVHKMKYSIGRFYAHYVTQFVHHPRAKHEQERLPQFWLYPDLPVPKKRKMALADVELNGGLHFNGAMIVRKPLRGETKIKGIKKHFRQNQDAYARDGIVRIHVKRIKKDHSRLTSYALKTIESGRWDENDILILPRTRSELSRSRHLSMDERRLKHLLSVCHLSQETAMWILADAKPGAHAHQRDLATWR